MRDLKQELRTLADRRSAESATDFDAVLTTARSRRHRRTAVWSAAAAAAVAVVTVFASTPWNDTETAPATTESPRIDSRWPNPITITPATAGPGQTLALTFPDESVRGLQFELTLETEPTRILYCLGSDGIGGKPSWSAAGDIAACGGPDVGVGGPGPDHVVVPDTAGDGTYRLCTANAAREICGLLTVRR